ncbi:TIGR02300 family protein [Tanticharoenia sakaeratensis]|jgi:uncharacterized protein (TIGR02300 family)|nr:TIGR02300 family protein [Tanticharoenia sakaeratensis]GBQ19744.1 hypothetical protein AA103193_1135 [Tanticharoenia sakaeratensis NBRC 103193]
MAKPELGLKRTCVSCNARFYDLGRTPAICPKCGAEQPSETPRLRRVAEPVPEKPKPDAENTDDADLAGDEETGDDVMEDTSDLDDDDDDLSNDIEVESDRDNDEN